MLRLLTLLVIGAALVAAPKAHAATTLVGPHGLTVEVTPPRGDHLGKPTRGVALMIHGGGWLSVGPRTIRDMDRYVGWVTRAGWTAVAVDYRPFSQSVEDTRAMYDWARRRYGRQRPFCVMGESAGAHLALMVAAFRSSASCVVGLGAATDLPELAESHPEFYSGIVVNVFGGPEGQRVYSPVTYATSIRADVLLGTAADDDVLPPVQLRRFLAASPRAHGMILRPGAAPFTHKPVSWVDRDLFRRRVVRLLHAQEPRPSRRGRVRGRT